MKKSSNSVNGERQILFICANCKRQADPEADNSTFKLCSGCHKVYYCNRECQLADRKNHKAFCKAVKTNDTNSTLINSKEDINDLLYYCKKGDLLGMQREISRGVNLVAASNDQLFSALTDSISGRFYECVELLLKHKANPNVQDKNGYTPLNIACQQVFEEFVSLLLHYNANPNILSNDDSWSPLHFACDKGSDKCVSLLIQHNANPNICSNEGGFSPLYVACNKGHDKCILLLLLQHNASQNIVAKKDGASPLYVACRNGHDKCVSVLLQHNADPNVLTVDNRLSPLYVVCQNGHDKCISLLLNAGANMEYVNVPGHTPLLIACFFGHLKCGALLVEHGANIHVQSITRHQTTLNLSCVSKNLNLVAYILSLGVDVNIPDAYGVTPIQYCYAYGFEKCVQLLFNHGADESTMKTPIPAEVPTEDAIMMGKALARTKHTRQQAKHCDYPDCCNEGNDSQSLHACSSCRAVYYCSREHQEAHWKEHKKLCKAIKK